MLKKIYNLINFALFITIMPLILFFPLVGYKIGIVTPIFPVIEIVLVYYYNKFNKLKTWIIMIFTILLDQLHSMPLGSSLLTIFLGNIILKKIHSWMNQDNPQADFILFVFYLTIIFILKYLLSIFLKLNISLLEFCFQYLTTLFTYPILKLILDKLTIFLSYNVRTNNS